MGDDLHPLTPMTPAARAWLTAGQPGPAAGYLPIPACAEQMGITERRVTDLAKAGVLQWSRVGGEVHVRPALGLR